MALRGGGHPDNPEKRRRGAKRELGREGKAMLTNVDYYVMRSGCQTA